MYKNKTAALIVRAYNEEKFITSVLNSIPAFIDRIYVVDDASQDSTQIKILTAAEKDHRIKMVNRLVRGGPGAATISGHKASLQDGNDLIVTIDGDGQMDLEILNRFLDPLSDGAADYVKGNRMSKHEHLQEMPAFRAFGNFLLTNLTKLASGYWHISDPQNGYTAITVETLEKLNLDKIETGFAFENDILVKLNVARARVKDIPHPAIYRGQSSKIQYSSFIMRTSWVLLRDFFWRLWKENFQLKSTHPHKVLVYTYHQAEKK